MGFDPKRPLPKAGAFDFDAIEILNGHDSERPEFGEQVLRDYWAMLNMGLRHAATGSSDSHRIQFLWAGYPRTIVRLDEKRAYARPLDANAVIAAVKKGNSTVTNGPVLDLEFSGVRPGEELVTSEDPVVGKLRIYAAPWVDVSEARIVVGGAIVQTFEIPSRPTKLGPEEGTLEEAQARTLRFETNLAIPFAGRNSWIQVVATGRRRTDDALPYMPMVPFALTNPVYFKKK